MIGYLFACLGAFANAIASALQRRAGMDQDQDEEMSLRLIAHLVRNKVWLFGILAVIAGFLLQATALGYGNLASIEPLLILELPVTVILAHHFFDEELVRRDWFAVAGMTIGLAGLIYFLSPNGGHPTQIAWWKWTIGLGVSFAAMGLFAWLGTRTEHDMGRAALWGTATGVGFGVTAALMKGMTEQLSQGFLNIFVSWQTYLMIAAGALSMYLLQNAMNAGPLVAAQPGFTLADPVTAILWGTLIFGESVRQGLFMLLAILSFALLVASVVVLSQSPTVQEGENAGDEGTGNGHEEHRSDGDGDGGEGDDDDPVSAYPRGGSSVATPEPAGSRDPAGGLAG